MKPVKIKLLKRTWTGQECEEYELSSPSKRKRKQKDEKENAAKKKDKPKGTKTRKKGAVLTESPVAGQKANIKNLKNDASSSSSSDSSSDMESDFDELEDLFLRLKKNGIKTIQTSPKTPDSQTKNNSSKKLNGSLQNSCPREERKSKKKLLEDFDSLPVSKEDKKKCSRKSAKGEIQDNVHEKENKENSLSPGLKINIKLGGEGKKTATDFKTSEKTPKKLNTTPNKRNSSRKKSSRHDSDVEIIDLEQIPEDSEVVTKVRQTRKTSSSSLDSPVLKSEDNELAKQKTPRRSLRNAAESFVPELEKLPEDLILNYKRTPKQVDRFVGEYTPQKTRSETPKKNFTKSRRSLTLNEELLTDGDTTPRKQRTKLTPLKLSASKKNETSSLRTPNSKIEGRVPTTPLEKARHSLHVAALPGGLPCREKEFNNIMTFVKNKLMDGIGGCMYISGVPGTGKTATVTQVIRQLRSSAKNGEVPDFKYIEINGMRLSEPRQAYVQVWQKLFDKEERIPTERAQKLLDNWFNTADKKNKRTTTVLLMDELDLICTKKQDVVYNFLDWPTRTHSRLVVLTIANTMDMPERLFKGRITSRMGLTRLTFMPYTFKQLEEIVSDRLKGLDAFVPDAVQLVTRKVAAVSGDARRALDICRRAAELPAPDETVKMCHIEQAIKEMTNSNIVRVIRDCSQMEKLFLRALCDVTFRSNIDEIELYNVIDHLTSICVLEGVSTPTVTSILTICHRLKCSRLIFSNHSYPGILQRVMLNVTQDDVHYALQT